MQQLADVRLGVLCARPFLAEPDVKLDWQGKRAMHDLLRPVDIKGKAAMV